MCSYRENPALGDPNSLVEELLQIRNKVRMRESDLAMVKGKVCHHGYDTNYTFQPSINVVACDYSLFVVAYPIVFTP